MIGCYVHVPNVHPLVLDATPNGQSINVTYVTSSVRSQLRTNVLMGISSHLVLCGSRVCVRVCARGGGMT